MSCNSTIHVTCPLAFTTYKYNELQVVIVTQKLNCKASCKRPLFFIVCEVLGWMKGFRVLFLAMLSFKHATMSQLMTKFVKF